MGTDRDLQMRFALVAGLFSLLFIIYLAGDIWVWRGAMLGNLAESVREEGGESAFWGAAVLYSLMAFYALMIAVINGQWFKWLTLALMVLLLVAQALKVLGGLSEYAQVGWYFMYLFMMNVVINIILVGCAYRWTKLATSQNKFDQVSPP